MGGLGLLVFSEISVGCFLTCGFSLKFLLVFLVISVGSFRLVGHFEKRFARFSTLLLSACLASCRLSRVVCRVLCVAPRVRMSSVACRVSSSVAVVAVAAATAAAVAVVAASSADVVFVASVLVVVAAAAAADTVILRSWFVDRSIFASLG